MNHRVCATLKHLIWMEKQTLKLDKWVSFFIFILLYCSHWRHNCDCKWINRVSKWPQTLRTLTTWCVSVGEWSVRAQTAICTSLWGTSGWIDTGGPWCRATCLALCPIYQLNSPLSRSRARTSALWGFRNYLIILPNKWKHLLQRY